jgi:hypothetical protein
MALKYSELKKKEVETPLTAEELRLVDEVETYIDGEIRKQWTSGRVNIDLCYTNFDYQPSKPNKPNVPSTDRRIDLSDYRKSKMTKELSRRFNEAGWNAKVEIDTSGSMNERDLWILTPKKR